MEKNQLSNVFTIAGFDGSGGAGIQADIKTFSAVGCYGTTVLTALPVQNTVGVRSIYEISTECVEEQLRAIFDDIKLDAVKIGMLHHSAIILKVANLLRFYKASNIVLDPVMVAKSGDKLLLSSAIEAMKKYLFPLATLVTPNLLEASEILKREIRNKKQMEKAAMDLLEMGPQAVIIKGGHLEGSCDDCLCLKNYEIYWFKQPRIHTKNTHGTGCTFSAAIAAFLAKKCSIVEAVARAKRYLTHAIQAGAQLTIGHGNGPVHHFHYLWNFLD